MVLGNKYVPKVISRDLLSRSVHMQCVKKNNSDITILSLLYGLVCFAALPPTQFYQEGTSPLGKPGLYSNDQSVMFKLMVTLVQKADFWQLKVFSAN